MVSIKTGLNAPQSGVSPVMFYKRRYLRLVSIETGLNVPQSGVSPVMFYKRKYLSKQCYLVIC